MENTDNIAVRDPVIHILRLLPGEDLRQTLLSFCQANQVTAGWMITAVGSLCEVNLRFANQPEGTTKKGFFEIIHLSGLLGEGGVHLHLGISDAQGQMTGGHLLEGSLVYTTVELVFASVSDTHFYRRADERTGFNELFFHQK